jgi:nitroreductase
MQPTTSPDQLLQCLQWRYATKRFDATRTIPDAAWQVLEQSLVLAPSSFGLQPWKFLVIDDPQLRAELQQQSWRQSQVTDASKYLVFAALRTTTDDDVDRFLQRTSAVRGTPIESMAGYGKVIKDFLVKSWAAKDLFGWNARQAYIALGQFMTSAALLGIDTCPMEGIDANGYDRALSLHGSRYATLCACAVGYRAADDKYGSVPKVRYPLDEVIERR